MSILLYIGGIGGSELLVICALIGAVTGYFCRNKNSKNGAVIGVVLGIIGGLVTSFLLAMFIYGSLIAMPLYAILGAWLFNLAWSKISK